MEMARYLKTEEITLQDTDWNLVFRLVNFEGSYLVVCSVFCSYCKDSLILFWKYFSCLIEERRTLEGEQLRTWSDRYFD